MNAVAVPGVRSSNYVVKGVQTILNRLEHTMTLSKSKKPLPEVTIPQYILKKRREKIRKRAESRIEREATNSPLIISCKRKELNHYRDNIYVENEQDTIPLKYLASGGWLHYKSKGDYFSINPHAKKDYLHKYKKFSDLGLGEPILDVIRSKGLTNPSHIQVEAIPPILSLSNVICAAETGGGKTLAYLLPILHRLHTSRCVGNVAPPARSCPRAVVLLSSKELASQVASVAQEVASPLQLDVLNLTGAVHLHKEIRSLKSSPRSIDVLVATPGSLNIALQSGAVSPTLVNHVVIDEADTLMDDSFSGLTAHILRQLSMKQSGIQGMQIILVSATMPSDLTALDNTISVDSFTHCTTEHLHQLLGHITQKFVRLGHADKPAEMVNILNNSPNSTTMVFANSCGTAKYLEELLTEHQVPCILLHSAMRPAERAGKFAAFQNGEQRVLVSSDVASRGLDTHNVRQVINYNFPKHISDYVHRAGRVGRISSKSSGKVVSLVGHRPEVNLVWQIERAVRSNTDISQFLGIKTKTLPNRNRRKGQ